jgi:ABC-type spermidine/putrescine transport system permease subunit I
MKADLSLPGGNVDALARHRRRAGQILFGLSAPAILGIMVVVFLPIVWLSSLSLFDRAGAFTLENYARIIDSELYVSTFWVTFEISAAVLVPFWTSVLVRTYAWLVLLQRNGLVNSWLQSLGLIDEPLQLAHNLTGSIIGMVHIMLPFLVLPLYASMKSIDTDVVRAAVGLGATPRRAFWNIFFPMSLPGLFAGIVLVFVLSLGFFVTPALLGGGRVQMIAQRIESTITLYSNWGAASALGVVLLVATLVLIWLLNRVFGLDRLFAR